MTTDAIDLDAYFARIGYGGPRAPTLAVLGDLCERQTRTIAFENLDPLLGRTPPLDLPAIENKLVRSRRGGYCYEQNMLLQHVLLALGFTVRGLAARVLLNAAPGTLTARTHMLLHVVAEEQDRLVDVGFGRLTPTAPLHIETEIEQRTPHETYRIDGVGGEYELSARVSGAWTLLYRFHLIEHLAVDYAVANHYVATCPTSFFRASIVAALAAETGRHALFNDRLTFQHRDGGRDERVLADADALLQVLETTFGLRIPDTSGLRAAFERIKAA